MHVNYMEKHCIYIQKFKYPIKSHGIPHSIYVIFKIEKYEKYRRAYSDRLFYYAKKGKTMTNEERLKKYRQEHCKRCKNKITDLCEIRVFAMNNIVYTKCGYFEVENEINTISQ